MSESPIKTFSRGPSNDYVQIAIWENTSQKGQVYHSVKRSRRYFDQGEWHETQTLYSHHLSHARRVDEKADDFIHDRLEEIRQEKREAKQQENEAEQSAPAKKRGQKKSHTAKLEERAATDRAK